MGNTTETIGIIICTTALFSAIMVCLAIPPKVTKKMLGTFAALTAVFSLLFYGYGYAHKENCPFWVAVIRATFAVCKVFVGSNDWDAVGAAFTTPVSQVAFWVLHLMGLFTSASALISSLGSTMIRKLRLWINRRKDISIIYGLSQNTLKFGRELAEKDDSFIIFVDQEPESGLSFAVDQMGAILRSDSDALLATTKFVQSMGLKRGDRKVRVYALSENHVFNQQFANHLLKSMKLRDISSDQTSLTIMGHSGETDNRFLTRSGQYGFGSVIAINEQEMVARMLVRTYPPCNSINFDEKGKAQNDFHCLIIGFGQVGQEVLRQLVMNGQFYDRHFKAAVFSPGFKQTMGSLAYECPWLQKEYDISFHPHDGRSCQLYKYVDQNAESLNYIAVCAGAESINMEIADQLRSYLKRRGCSAPVYVCTRSAIYHEVSNDKFDADNDDKLEIHNIYTSTVLCSDDIDRMAKVVNQYYIDEKNLEEKAIEDNWRKCVYFNRMSSRATADFCDAFLRAAHVTKEQAKAHWSPDKDLVENLAKMEHLRWNAFHYCNGFRPLTEEEFQSRAAIYLEEKKKDPKTNYRITRDVEQRIHGCLIPWEKLDEYYDKEKEFTGREEKFTDIDRKIIRSIGAIMRAVDKKDEKK